MDVGESEKSANIILQLEKLYDSKLAYILTTHKHHDHIGGNEFWMKERPDLKVIGSNLEPESIPGLKKEDAMSDLQTMTIGDLCISCMETPGHTSDHCSFIVTHVTPVSNKNPFLFCGDTMFVGGAGRLLGGTADQLFDSFKKLMSLPNETLLFCGHEYTEKNLAFALMLEPENDTIHSKLDMVRSMPAQSFSVGNQISEERHYNPFVRCFGADLDTKKYFEDITGESAGSTERVFAKIRKLKD